ncbi:hypothetical protein W02_03720 [Nitrospira sp. KM1]|uniref:hypothetical protein n=1 Tax=Nitrospira sp. KM1 TaxID=1936990 RepID=UPI0013A7559F|nr:hypothetical protein [Nitrospira sp. KM1]BCA53232.1 hypothetical protein W02_03720 [Nitrospira sp. KM1]
MAEILIVMIPVALVLIGIAVTIHPDNGARNKIPIIMVLSALGALGIWLNYVELITIKEERTNLSIAIDDLRTVNAGLRATNADLKQQAENVVREKHSTDQVTGEHKPLVAPRKADQEKRSTETPQGRVTGL